MATTINGAEKSPCICAKVKFALGLLNHFIDNNKKCSISYWNEIVDYFAQLNSVPKEKVEIAKSRFDLYR